MNGPLNNSEEWEEIHPRLITASNFKRVIGQFVQGDWSPTAKRYAYEIAAYTNTGIRKERPKDSSMLWGIENEPFAIQAYEEAYFATTEKGRLIVKPDTIIGASPDAFVGKNGLLECKCPETSTHMETIINGQMPFIHFPQVQGQLWVTGREWCDFVSFDPRMKDPSKRLFVQRIPRHEGFITEMGLTLLRFQEKVRAYTNFKNA